MTVSEGGRVGEWESGRECDRMKEREERDWRRRCTGVLLTFNIAVVQQHDKHGKHHTWHERRCWYHTHCTYDDDVVVVLVCGARIVVCWVFFLAENERDTRLERDRPGGGAQGPRVSVSE